MTGGAGFIGSQLARELLSTGLQVVVLDNLSVGRAERVPEGATLIVGDILDHGDVERAVHGCDIVFHLAARVAIRSSFDFVYEDAMTNAAGTASLLRGIRRARTVRKLISTSSMAVYADSDLAVPIAESHPVAPVSPYGICKFAAELLTHNVCSEKGIDSTVLRLFNTYGPGQTLSPYVGVVTIFVDTLQRGESPRVFGDGEQCRDFVHVADVTAGFVRAMRAAGSGQTYNIGSGTGLTVNEVFRILSKVTGSAVEPTHVAPAKGELRNSIADISKARRELNYRPVHRFEDSIADVVNEITAASRGQPRD